MNLYDPHPLMIDSGTFWRCAHGTTGFASGLRWIGCADCRKENPEGYARFHKSDIADAPPSEGDRQR